MVSLTSGVLFLCLAVVGFVVVLLGARNPRNPSWAGDFWMGSVYTPGIIALAVFGLATLIQVGFDASPEPLRLAEVWPSAAVLVATAALVKALRPRRTLAAWAAQQTAAEKLATLPLSAPLGGGERPEPPVKPTRPRLAA